MIDTGVAFEAEACKIKTSAGLFVLRDCSCIPQLQTRDKFIRSNRFWPFLRIILPKAMPRRIVRKKKSALAALMFSGMTPSA